MYNSFLASRIHHMLDSRVCADDQEGKTIDDKSASRKDVIPSAPLFKKLKIHCWRTNETNETQEETSDKVGEVGEVRDEPANEARDKNEGCSDDHTTTTLPESELGFLA